MLTEKEVQHIAKLARLGLSKQEIGKFQRELSKILAHIEKLKEVDISGVEPTSQSVLAENVIRKDEIRNQKPETRDKIIDLFPEKKEGYLKVNSILK